MRKRDFIPLALGIFCLIFFHFYKIKDLPNIPCAFKQIYHLPCPACGGTRSFICFMQLDFIKAFQYNFICVILFIYIAYIYFRYLIQKILKKKITKINVIYPTVIFAILLISYDILRIIFPISLG